MTPNEALCGLVVYWWDGEYEGNCELPEDHNGPHFDGLSWYDDDMNEVEAPVKGLAEMLSFLTETSRVPLSGIWASHKVPYGRSFRQWDTNGRLWCWANRGEIEDLPRTERGPGVNFSIIGVNISDIPIHNRE